MLSAKHLRAIKRYTGPGHVEINGDLRGDSNGDPAVHSDIYWLDRALEAVAVPEVLEVYRGIDRVYAQELERRGLRSGDIIQDKGFLSTSRNRGVARRFLGYEEGGMLLRILIPKGSCALDLSLYSTNPDEQEILLPREANRRVLGYDAENDVLNVEVVPHA